MKRVFLLAALILIVASTGLYADFAMDTSLSDSDASFWGEACEDFAGWSVSNAGDVNGDGYDDFAIGAYANDGGFLRGPAYAGRPVLVAGRLRRRHGLVRGPARILLQFTDATQLGT